MPVASSMNQIFFPSKVSDDQMNTFIGSSFSIPSLSKWGLLCTWWDGGCYNMLGNKEADFYLISIKHLKFQAEIFCERVTG